MCCVPAAELGAEAGGAAGDDRHLLAADRSFLHLAVRTLRHRAPQHRVSASTDAVGYERNVCVSS